MTPGTGEHAPRVAEESGAGTRTADGGGAAARILKAVFSRIEIGSLEIIMPGGAAHRVEGSRPGGHGVLELHTPAAARRAILGGGTGFAEGYIAGWWDTPDLVSLLDVLAANIALGLIETRVSPQQPLERLAHLVRPNTRRGARRNIAHHYDRGNDFYRRWLDETMTYSAALFREEHPAGCSRGSCPAPAGDLPLPATEEELAAAQRAKWDRLLDVLDPRPGERLLEIGCGWGGFALHAAESRDLQVTGITISNEQLTHSLAEAERRGLSDRVEFRLQDYREIAGRYDLVASIEMFEAVGERYWDTFFGSLRAALAPGGRAALQVITIDPKRYAVYRKTTDFIQRYIFPGGMLPTPQIFSAAARRAGLQTEDTAFFGLSYAKTLRTWLTRFDEGVERGDGPLLDPEFRRMWRYYLAYCIAGFRNGLIDVMQARLSPAAPASISSV